MSISHLASHECSQPIVGLPHASSTGIVTNTTIVTTEMWIDHAEGVAALAREQRRRPRAALDKAVDHRVVVPPEPRSSSPSRRSRAGCGGASASGWPSRSAAAPARPASGRRRPRRCRRPRRGARARAPRGARRSASRRAGRRGCPPAGRARPRASSSAAASRSRPWRRSRSSRARDRSRRARARRRRRHPAPQLPAAHDALIPRAAAICARVSSGRRARASRARSDTRAVADRAIGSRRRFAVGIRPSDGPSAASTPSLCERRVRSSSSAPSMSLDRNRRATCSGASVGVGVGPRASDRAWRARARRSERR